LERKKKGKGEGKKGLGAQGEEKRRRESEYGRGSSGTKSGPFVSDFLFTVLVEEGNRGSLRNRVDSPCMRPKTQAERNGEKCCLFVLSVRPEKLGRF